MGVLRLLYCDSAGIRRCRAIVYTGDLPAPSFSKAPITDATTDAAEHEPELAAVPGQLNTTPSLLEAAAAGIISLPPTGAPGSPDQQPQQHGLASFETLPAEVSAAAGPFATRQAALAAAGDGSFTSQGAARSSSVVSGSFALQSSMGSLLSPASSLRLLQPLSAAQLAVAKAAVPYSVGLTKGTMGMPAVADSVLPDSGLSAVGEVLLVPDLSAVQPLPWAQGHCIAPVDMLERDLSKPFVCCPRSALKHALATLKAAHGVRLLVGFELEFMLLKPAAAGSAVADSELVLQSGGSCFRPIDDSVYCQSSAFDQAAPVLDRMVSALQSMGIGVVQYHAESAPGQFEIATKPFPALQAADKLLLTKEVISGVARQAGLEVTFLPKPLPGCAGSGCHCHISLWKARSTEGSSSEEAVSLMTAPQAAAVGALAGPLPSQPSAGSATAANQQPSSSSNSSNSSHYVPGYPLLSSTAASFLAGLLDHLPALLPFTCPTENSYARLKPGTWSGAVTCWGWDNREAPLRLCCPSVTDPAGSCNIELKAFDATANPYIGLAAIIAAGMRGMQEAASLPPPLQVEPAAALAAAAAGAAVSKLQQLPGSLAEALAALQRDNSMQIKVQQLLGPDLLRAYLAVKTWEAAQQTSKDKLLLRY